MPSQLNEVCGMTFVSFHDGFCVTNHFDPARADDLRQRPGVPERVGQPCLGGVDTELLEEEALARDELACEGLATGQVRVRLDPHAAHGDPASLGDALLDAREDRRVLVPDPGVLLRGRAREREVGVAVHQVEHVREGPGALALRLADRPEPGGVDVRVPDGDRPVRRARRRDREHGFQHGAGGSSGPGDVIGVECIGGTLEGPQDVRAAGAVGRQLGHQAAQDPEVLLQLPDGVVALDDVQGRDPVDRLVTSGGAGPERGRALERVAADVRVRAGLDVELERLPGADRQRHGVVARLDGLDRGAVRAVGEPLGLEAGVPLGEPEVDEQFRRRALGGAEVRRHGAGDVEPGGAPRATAPGRADLERGVASGRRPGRRAPVRPAPPTPRW